MYNKNVLLVEYRTRTVCRAESAAASPPRRPELGINLNIFPTRAEFKEVYKFQTVLIHVMELETLPILSALFLF